VTSLENFWRLLQLPRRSVPRDEDGNASASLPAVGAFRCAPPRSPAVLPHDPAFPHQLQFRAASGRCTRGRAERGRRGRGESKWVRSSGWSGTSAGRFRRNRRSAGNRCSDGRRDPDCAGQPSNYPNHDSCFGQLAWRNHESSCDGPARRANSAYERATAFFAPPGPRSRSARSAPSRTPPKWQRGRR
jgi:hypothetical protein